MGRQTESQWQAGRTYCEGWPATRSRLAAIMGVDTSAVYARAEAEGWRSPDYRRADVRGWQEEIRRSAEERHGGAAGFEPTPDIDAEADALYDATVSGAAGMPGQGGSPAEGEGLEAAVAGARDNPVQLLARATEFVSRQLGRLMDAAERRGGRLDKKQIEGLAALARMMERWETLARERAKEEEAKSDADVAESLRRIDECIVRLAAQEARRLVAAGYRPEDA